MRQNGALSTFTWLFRECPASSASAASPCRRRFVGNCSPTCVPTSGQQNGAWIYAKTATGARSSHCWTNHEAVDNHLRHHFNFTCISLLGNWQLLTGDSLYDSHGDSLYIDCLVGTDCWCARGSCLRRGGTWI